MVVKGYGKKGNGEKGYLCRLNFTKLENKLVIIKKVIIKTGKYNITTVCTYICLLNIVYTLSFNEI